MPIVLAAPHRLAFLVGTLNLAGLAVWWLLSLASLHLGFPTMSEGRIPAGLLHGPAMLYLVYPPFVFGFLLTVFPRWMSFPDLQPRDFAPVSILLAAGSIVVQAALWLGLDHAVPIGFGLVGLGWALGIQRLGKVLLANRREGRPPAWHASSALAALILGLIGLLAAITFLVTLDPRAWHIGNRLGLTGFVLPVFLTVAHRMVPFFASGVISGYVAWRPYWLLAALWAALALRAVGELGGLDELSVVANGALATLTGLMAWKWWPRGASPGLLKVLFWGFVWAPIGCAMAVVAAMGLPLGRAPDHALFIGFAGSLVVAMVTRVTQGHSGRPLEMPQAAWLAFAAIQGAAVFRVGAALHNEYGVLLLIAATLFVFGLLPWTVRHALIYLRPRADGRPG